jgi:dynein intermediate chain 2
MNTMRAAFSDATFMHTEGGWPKDVIITEQESVMRYRKKLEKEESFQAAVPALAEVSTLMYRLVSKILVK